MNYCKKYIIILIIVIGIFLIFSNQSEVEAKTISGFKEYNTKMNEDVRVDRFKVLATPQIKVEDDQIQQDMNKYYYSQLQHEISKNTYNTIATELKNDIVVSINDYEYSLNELTEEAASECFEKNIVPYVLDGYEAYIMDGAKNYWWTPDGIKIGFKNAVIANNKVIFKYVEIISYAEEWSNYNNFNAKLKEVTNSITGNSVYEIVRSINHYICKNVKYEILNDTDIEQTAYGALMMNKAVCEGQAQLFNLLCREKGITSINVYGYVSSTNNTTAHAWNYVFEPKAQKWYAVDVTWNNQFDDVLYLMVGSKTEINGEKFYKNHIPGFKQYVLQTYTPENISLNDERYIEPITIDGIYMRNIQPNTKYKEFVKEFSSNIVFTVKENDKTINEEDLIKTGQSFKFNNLEYILLVKGDINGDGRANIQDIMTINKHRLHKIKLTQENIDAGDIDKNSILDIKDILQINKYRLGKINEF